MGKSNIESATDPTDKVAAPTSTLDDLAAAVKVARADVAAKSKARSDAINALPETAALNAAMGALQTAQTALAQAVAAATGQPGQTPSRASIVDSARARRGGLQRLAQAK